MYDCFNMAYQDNANALQLHIKVNSENLLPISQKYNAGTLRIPADPSWPKIPQRKLANEFDDIIDPPCIITLSGTPRKSRTMVQTSLNQSPKSVITKDSAYSSFCHQKATSSMHTLKKLPGYVDPRFKKVTNIKRNQVTSTEFLEGKTNQFDITTSTEDNQEMEKPIPERDINIGQIKIQEAEKFENRKTEVPQTICDSKSYIKTNKCIQDYKNKTLNINQELILKKTHCTSDVESKNLNNISENINKNENIEKSKCAKIVDSSEHVLKSTMNDANTQVDITLPVQENNGKLFFVLDKKPQAHPLNAIHLDTIAIPQEYVNHYYNVQVPVLTYQNTPIQISTTGANDLIQQCLNNSEHGNQNNTASSVKKESEPHIYSTNVESSKQFVETTSNQTQKMEKSFVNDAEEEHAQDSKRKTTLIQSIIPDENKNSCFKPENPNVPEKLQNTNIQEKQQESSDSEYYIPNISKRNVHNNVQCPKMKKITYNTSVEETTNSESIVTKNVEKKKFVDNDKNITKVNKINTGTVHGDIKTSIKHHGHMNFISKETECLESVPQSNVIVGDQDQQSYQEYKTITSEAKGRNKSEQNLSCIKSECPRKLCRNSEPYITFKQKRASAKFYRKARSYFQKNSHSALVDSDYTLVWPNCQHIKYKRGQISTHKLNNYKTKKIGNSSNFAEHKLRNNGNVDLSHEMARNLSKTCVQKDRCKCEISPRSNIDDTIERPKGISPKTQELLNKSYWEFYNKLRHKIKDTVNTEQQYPYQLATNISEKGKKGKVNEVYDKELRNQLKLNPELQTLQQCSALSSMINKALDTNLQSDVIQTKQLYTNENVKLSTNPIEGMQNVNVKKMISNLNNGEPILNKIRCKKNNINDKQFLELKSIIFFGGMMYILIIFLPMLYDYFYHEEYDDYENLSYLELIAEYILSSFKEAFGDIFNGVKQIFFYLHACKKCSNIA